MFSITAGHSAAYDLFNEARNKVGEVDLTYNPVTKDLWTDKIQSKLGDLSKLSDWENWGASPNANTLGISNMRSLLRELKKEYPEAETLSGDRVSGARAATGSGGATASIRLKTPTSK